MILGPTYMVESGYNKGFKIKLTLTVYNINVIKMNYIIKIATG